MPVNCDKVWSGFCFRASVFLYIYMYIVEFIVISAVQAEFTKLLSTFLKEK